MEAIEILKKYEHILSLSGIEQELGIPQSTLHKAVKDVRPLPQKWDGILKGYFKAIGEKLTE